MTNSTIVLDLYSVEERLVEYSNLSTSRPSNEELEKIITSIRWHQTSNIPLNIRNYAERLEKEVLDFCVEPLLFLEHFPR